MTRNVTTRDLRERSARLLDGPVGQLVAPRGAGFGGPQALRHEQRLEGGEPFELAIPVGIRLDAAGPARVEILTMTGPEAQLRLSVEREPADLILDPALLVLMEASFERRR